MLACKLNCDTCTNQLTCTACTAGFYLYSESCYSKCPNGYFKDASANPDACTSKLILSQKLVSKYLCFQ